MTKDKWFLHGGRGSGKTIRLLCETYENKIANLEKENAELQQKWLDESYEKAKLVEKWKHNGENIIQECKDIEGAKTYYEHQLTKAKAIIKTFLGFAEAFGYSPSMDKFITEAEQFLKDSKQEGKK